MVNKQIRNKQGRGSLMGIVVGMILVIGIFSGLFLFYTEQLSNNGVSVDSKYNTTYNQLLEVQNNMDDRVNDIKTTADDVREAESGFLVAINGFKGLGQSLLLLLGFSSDSIDITQALLLSTDVIPSWVQTLIVIILIAFVIFIIIDVLIGRKPITN